MRLFAPIALAGLLTAPLVAQVPDPPVVFLVADVHPSAHTMYPFPRSTFHNGLYSWRQATIVDLIANAYKVDPANVAGGPSWLETDHFDIYAKTPAKTSPDAAKLMLRSLLAERFKLVLHTDSKPLPAFVLSVGKSPKLTESDGSGDPACKFIDPPPNPPAGSVPLYEFACRNMTMEAFAENLHQWAGDYITSPIVDATGLTAAYDFNIKFHAKSRAARAGADGITIFDAVDKQLGLKLEARTAPLPVVAIDSVEERPTPNVADIEKLLPPPAPSEFEVATVKPSAPGGTGINGRINGGSVSLEGGTMQFMITFAYDITGEMIVGAPKWIETDRFDVNAKASSDSPAGQPGAPQMDPDDLRVMMRKFLAERFNLKAHMEDRPLDAYTLVAAKPNLKKADPANRTGCKEGPGADGKDPRIANPILGRLLTCRSMTMTQFAAILQAQASGYIHTPVLDSTGIEGNYDFTLSFSSAGQLQSGPSGPPSPDAAAGTASDPNGGLSLPDAISRQMGLKLVKGKRPVPSLVIDHIDEKPTEN